MLLIIQDILKTVFKQIDRSYSMLKAIADPGQLLMNYCHELTTLTKAGQPRLPYKRLFFFFVSTSLKMKTKILEFISIQMLVLVYCLLLLLFCG